MRRMLLIFTLVLTGCASLGGARHVATVSVVTVHSVLGALQDGEMRLGCGKPSAPAPPACVADAVHRRISADLVTAFDLDGRVARLVRAVPAGTPTPVEVAELLGQITGLIDRIVHAIPTSTQKTTLVQQIGGTP